MRAHIGQEFEVACGERVRKANVASVCDDRVEFILGNEVTATAVVPITLLLAIFKFDRMEWAIEKCTELNVTTIIPVVARRTEKHLALAAGKRVERWRRIAREAAEQSRRTSPPEIGEPLKLKDALELKPGSERNAGLAQGSESQESQPRRGESDVSPGRKPGVERQIGQSPVGTAQVLSRTATGGRGAWREETTVACDLRVVLAETEREATLSEILRAHDNLKSLALAIGPEGGWTADELLSFGKSQWIAASLGETILRAETAAIAALAIARADVQPG